MRTLIIKTPTSPEFDHMGTVRRLEGVVCALDQQIEVLEDGTLFVNSFETGDELSLEAALLFMKDYAEEGFDWPIEFTP